MANGTQAALTAVSVGQAVAEGLGLVSGQRVTAARVQGETGVYAVRLPKAAAYRYDLGYVARERNSSRGRNAAGYVERHVRQELGRDVKVGGVTFGREYATVTLHVA